MIHGLLIVMYVLINISQKKHEPKFAYIIYVNGKPGGIFAEQYGAYYSLRAATNCHVKNLRTFKPEYSDLVNIMENTTKDILYTGIQEIYFAQADEIADKILSSANPDMPKISYLSKKYNLNSDSYNITNNTPVIPFISIEFNNKLEEDNNAISLYTGFNFTIFFIFNRK